MSLDNLASPDINLPDPVTDVPVAPPVTASPSPAVAPDKPIDPVIIQDTVDKFLAHQKAQEKDAQGTQMRLNVGAKIMQDPAQEAQFKAIAGVLGIPVDTVRALPEDSLRRSRLAAIDFNEVQNLYPGATRVFASPDGGVAAQDAPTVLEMEDIVRGIDPTLSPGKKQAIINARTQAAIQNRHTNEALSLGASTLGAFGDLVKQVERFGLVAPSLAADVAFEFGTWATSSQSFDTTAGNIAQRLQNPFQNPDGSPREGFAGALAPNSNTPVGAALQSKVKMGPPRMLVDETTKEQFENPDYYRFGQGSAQRVGAEFLSRDTLNMVPQIAAMGAAASIGVTPLMFSGGMGLDRYIRAGQEGADPLTAVGVGVGDGLLNMGLMSKIPQFNLGFKTGGLLAPGTAIANPTLTYAGRSLGLATGMTISGNLLTNLYKPTHLLEGLQDQAVTFLGFELPGYAAHTLNSLQSSAQRSKLAKASPEVLKEAMRTNLAGSEYENTMVTTDKFVETVLLQSGNPREVATRLKALNIDEALGSADGKTAGSGVDLIFPTHELLTTDPKLVDALAPDRHTFPNEMTRRQQETWLKGGGPEQLTKLMEAADAETQSTPEYQQARETFKARYEAAGETPEVAHEMAALMADVYYNLSKESKITIDEAVKYFDPKIVFGEAPERGAHAQPGLGPVPEGTAPTLRERIAEEANWATNHRQEVIDHYLSTTNVINGDDFNSMLPTVQRNPTFGHLHAMEHGGMGLVAVDAFHQMLARPVGEDTRPVIILVGNAAAGKSTFAENYKSQAYLVLDTNAADPKGLQDNINSVLRSGRNVDVVYVHTPIEEAVRRNIDRQGQFGRPVAISAQADMAVSTPTNFSQAHEVFANEPGVGFVTVEMTPEGKARGALGGDAAIAEVNRIREENGQGSVLNRATQAYTEHLKGLSDANAPTRDARAAFEQGLGDAVPGLLPGEQAGGRGTPGVAEEAAAPESAPAPVDFNPRLEAPLFQPPVERTGASLHTLGVERDERTVGTRSSLSADEKQIVADGSKEHGFKAKEIEAQVREAKLRFPRTDGWDGLVLKKVSMEEAEDGTKKPVLEYKVVPYSFDRNAEGKSIKFGSPEYQKRVELLGRNMRDEVLAVFERAQKGDEAAKKILAQSGWYREMRARLRHEFGGLGDFMADNLGALSPNTDVMWNWKNAIDIVKRATRGDFDAEIPKWAAHFDAITQKENDLKSWFQDQQAQGLTKKAIKASTEYTQKYAEISDLKNQSREIMPVKENGAKYGFNGVNAMRAVVDLWRVIKEADPDINRGGQAPKALNFSGNLIGFRERATIDVWAARMLNRLAGAARIPVPAESGVAGEMLPDGSTKGQFRAGQDVFTNAKDLIRAHDKMGKDETLSKLNDDDLQALVWFIEKELWTKNNWTSAAGEGGSFELEANLAGSKEQGQIGRLRSLINSGSTPPEARAKAQEQVDALHRTMDRYTGGLSVQQSAGTQGVDFVPGDGVQAIVQQRLKNAIYAADPTAIVMGSKVMSTQGRYMGEGERSIDLEVTAREGYDPTQLHLEMLRLAQENNQQSMFFSRVLRAEEDADPTRHRPGVEIYFKNKGSMEDLQPLLDKLHEDLPFYTVVMNGRPTEATKAGSEGDVVGVRMQYMPEFLDNFDGLRGLTDEEIGRRMVAQADALTDLAQKIKDGNPEVTSALTLWYDSEVTFADKYQETIDALSSRPAGSTDQEGRGSSWKGRLHSASLERSASFAEAASRAEGGNGEASGEPLPGRDAAHAQGLGFQHVDVRTPEFKAWFGEDSNLLNPGGGPMQLYHGTSKDFTEFKASERGAMGKDMVYLGQAPEASEGYGDRLMPVFARGKYLDNYEWTDYIHKFGSEGAREAAMKDGWAGVRDDKFEDAVAVFDPKNIKSAMSNTGKFDPNNPSILFQPPVESMRPADVSAEFDKVLEANDQQKIADAIDKASSGLMDIDPETGRIFMEDRDNKRTYLKGKDLTDMKREFLKAYHEGEPLYQPETGGASKSPRGWFRVLPDGSFEIGKTKFGDLSTFVHEPAHSYLYMIKDLQAREGASETLKADWQHILKFLGSEDGNFTDAQHEKWASANETYFAEGKAPTPALAGAFQRISLWMHSIYQAAVVNGVELTPEIRGVFDRMYAGREAVAQAKEVVNTKPLFATAEDMGISQAHFDLYASKSEKAITTAQQAVISHLQRDFQREHQAWWKDESSKIKDQVTAEVKADPVYRAINAIKDGKLTVTGENGATWTVDIKLNRQMIIDQFGEEMIKKMPKGTRDYKGEGTMDAEGAAEVLGFKSGTELMNALTGAEPEGALIKRVTHERMVAKHGDLLTDGRLNDAAVEAIHNQAREEMLQAELKALRAKEREMKPAMDFQRKLDAAKSEEERTKVQAAWEAYKADQKAKASQERQDARDAMGLPPTQALKEQAQVLVDKSSVRDLEPFRYLLASRKNSRDAFEAMGNKDWAAAAKAKQFEIMNHHLYLAATEAKMEAAKIYKYGKMGESDRFQGMLGKAGGDFQAQWNALASRYEFRQVTNKELDTRTSLGEWVAANAEDGATIDPSILLDGPTKNWREVPMSELRAVRDGLKNIETVARHQLGYDLAGKKLVFDAEIGAFEAKARESNSSKTTPRQGTKKTALETVTSLAQGFNAYMQKMEWFVDQLDGGDINGPARKNIKAPIDEASGREKAMADVIKHRLHEVFSTMSHSDRLREYDSVGVQFPSMDRPMNRMQLFSWALNLGTEENRKVAILGEGLMGADGALRPEFDAALSKLTAAEARRIQGVWDSLESLRPEIIAKERRVKGIEPKWKKLTPFTIHTVDGETIQMAGGYYPLKADHNISSIGRRQMDPGVQEGTFTRPTVSNSHTQEVTGATYPLLLDYPSVLSQHLPAVIKNVTMGEAISYVSKFIMNDAVAQTMRETIGIDKEREFLPWLQSVAGQGVDNSQSGPIIRFLMSRRMGMVIARLGGNITSYLVQGGDSFKLLANESPALLTKHLPQAIYDIRTNPKAMIEEIRRLSPNEMAFREENSNREIRDMLTSKSPVDEAKQRTAEFLMTGFMVMDRLQTFPAWLAKYREGLTTHGNEAQAIMEADRLIATTFQAGEARNMARVMREPGMVKLFTTFQGDANTWYGLLSSAFESKNLVRISTSLMALIAEQAVTQAIRGRLPQKDNEWGEWSLEQTLSALLNPLGIFGDLADYGVKKLQGKYAKFNNPTLDAIEKMFTLPSEIHNYATSKPGHDAEALSIATLDAVGMWSGIPLTGQIVKSWKYQHGIRIGTQPHPQTTLEEIKNTLLGPPPKEKP